jgi:CMP/dCMP kinase
VQKLTLFRNDKPVITIDGTAGSGKGTLAKKIAFSLGYDHLDTGLLYRYLAYLKISKGLNLDEVGTLKSLKINYPLIKKIRLKTELISKEASIISKEKIVRDFLLSFQRNFANKPPSLKGSVIDGRDIGSVVIPNAEIKFFIDASTDIRVKRRLKELNLSEENNAKEYKNVFSQIEDRDNRDKTRKRSPLLVPEGAYSIDTTNLSIDDVLIKALTVINSILSNKTN